MAPWRPLTVSLHFESRLQNWVTSERWGTWKVIYPPVFPTGVCVSGTSLQQAAVYVSQSVQSWITVSEVAESDHFELKKQLSKVWISTALWNCGHFFLFLSPSNVLCSASVCKQITHLEILRFMSPTTFFFVSSSGLYPYLAAVSVKKKWILDRNCAHSVQMRFHQSAPCQKIFSSYVKDLFFSMG